MWLFQNANIENEWDNKGLTPDSIATTVENAIKKINFDTTVKAITEMDNQAKTLQRTMASGMVFEASNFREQLFKSYRETLQIGGTFEDITKAVEGFSKGMSKIVFMTNDITKNGETFAGGLVALEKSTGIASDALGGMVSDFIRLDGSQIKSVERMQDIARVARVSGLNSQKLLEEVKGSLSKIDSYGFKGGIDGLSKMAAQAQLLRTSVDEIGALTKAQDLWDPEKAIETASKLQMLGGAIGDLGDPFKLMNMGMNDVEALQDQMVKLAANAFNLNKETGEFEIDNVSRQRLKEQAEAMGSTLEKMTKIGREAKKAQEVMDTMAQTSFGEGMPKESKDLLASLTEFKGGKMVLDIPGFKTGDLESAMIRQPEKLKQALEEYQSVASKSDRQIAEKGLTLQESLNRDARIIRDTVVLNLKPTDRQGIVNALEQGIDIIGGAGSQKIESAAQDTRTAVGNIGNIIQTRVSQIRSGGYVPPVVSSTPTTPTPTPIPIVPDAAITSGEKIITLGKNEMFKTIPEDEGMFAPNLLSKMDFLKNTFLSVKNFTESIETTFTPPTFIPPKMETKEMTPMTTNNQLQTIKQEVEASGDININININSGGALSDALMKDRNFTQDLKTRVMNIIKDKTKIIAEKGQVG